MHPIRSGSLEPGLWLQRPQRPRGWTQLSLWVPRVGWASTLTACSVCSPAQVPGGSGWWEQPKQRVAKPSLKLEGGVSPGVSAP